MEKMQSEIAALRAELDELRRDALGMAASLQAAQRRVKELTDVDETPGLKYISFTCRELETELVAGVKLTAMLDERGPGWDVEVHEVYVGNVDISGVLSAAAYERMDRDVRRALAPETESPRAIAQAGAIARRAPV